MKFVSEKILICTSKTIPYNAGGGKNAYNFAKFLSNENLNISLLTLNENLYFHPVKLLCTQTCLRFHRVSRETVIDSLHVYRIPYFHRNIILKLLSLTVIIPGYLYYVLKNDIIFIFGRMFVFEFLIFFGWLFKKKVIFRSSMFGDDDIKTLITKHSTLQTIRKKILSLITLYFSLTPAFSKSYLSVFHTDYKIFESPQGVNTGVFHPVIKSEKIKLRKKLNLPENQFIIISVGYLIKRKGFVEIFETLNKLNIPFLYVIVGDYKVPKSHYLYKKKQKMENLYNLGKKLLGEKVLFTGQKENVNEYLQSADIFLLNSFKEGLPNVLLEAMACGITPIVRNIIGVNNYITFHKINALVFENKEQMSELIVEIYKNKKMRDELAKKSQETINNNYSFELIYEKLSIVDWGIG